MLGLIPQTCFYLIVVWLEVIWSFVVTDETQRKFPQGRKLVVASNIKQKFPLKSLDLQEYLRYITSIEKWKISRSSKYVQFIYSWCKKAT